MKKTSRLGEVKTTPEILLLLLCARTHLDAEAQLAVKELLSQSLDWNLLLEIANYQGVAGLVYQNLHNLGSTLVPTEILSQLLLLCRQYTVQNMLLMHELRKLQFRFAAQAIPVISFKGPLLSASLYQNLGLRHTSDLDLLVPPQFFQQAIDLLILEGYQPTREWKFLNSGRELAHIQAWHEYSLSNGSVNIDLHQALTPNYFLTKEPDFDDLWQNRQLNSCLGSSVWSFGTEDLLVYLTIHGSKECWRRLKWICDIAQFVDAYPETDWSGTIARSQEFGSERMLLIGFRIAQLLLNLTVPPKIQQRIEADPICTAIADDLAHNLFSSSDSLSNKFSFRKTLLHFRMMQTFRDRLNCLTYLREPIREWSTILFPNDRDEEFLPLPLKLHFLYYVIHPYRLIIKRLKALRESWQRSFST